ncbi:hypothetical protein LCGC14_1025110, partial [marine sediment metagenome]
MATLKICTHDQTHWLTEVSEIQQISSFSIPESVNDENDIVSAAK